MIIRLKTAIQSSGTILVILWADKKVAQPVIHCTDVVRYSIVIQVSAKVFPNWTLRPWVFSRIDIGVIKLFNRLISIPWLESKIEGRLTGNVICHGHPVKALREHLIIRINKYVFL